MIAGSKSCNFLFCQTVEKKSLLLSWAHFRVCDTRGNPGMSWIFSVTLENPVKMLENTDFPQNPGNLLSKTASRIVCSLDASCTHCGLRGMVFTHLDLDGSVYPYRLFTLVLDSRST